MIALMILMVTCLALMQASLLATRMNVQNSMRDQAISLAEQRMGELRNLPFTTTTVANDLLATSPSGSAEPGLTSMIRSAPVTYTSTRTVVDIDANTKQLTLNYVWTFKNQPNQHRITTILRRQQ